MDEMKNNLTKALATALAVVFIGPSAANAQTPATPSEAKSVSQPSPLALTLSGGGTKGAYMAGHLYYMDLVARQPGNSLSPKVFTGASAGAINAVVSALSSCQPAASLPTESLYWSTWTKIGLAELFDPAETVGVGLLTPKAFAPAIAQMRQIWDAGLPTSCDLIIGVAITRLKPRMVVLAPGFPALPRSSETVLLRLTGRGLGQPPKLRNVVDPARPIPDLQLPLGGPVSEPFEMLVRLILASSAFPVGFPPVEIPHCTVTSDASGPIPCTRETAVPALFVDGGIFDNQPLGLAVRAMHHVKDDSAGGHVLTDRPQPALPNNARYYFLDPRARTFPEPLPSAKGAPDDVVDIITALFGMVESASSAGLVSTLDQQPNVRAGLIVARTHMPQISSTFDGLLERAFREFDFYLGMYNAARTVREHPLGATVAGDTLTTRRQGAADTAAWRPFQCLRAVLDKVGDIGVCDHPDLQDFRGLLQVVLDRLYDGCRRLPAGPTTGHAMCDAARSGAAAPQVPGIPQISATERRQQGGESTLSYQLRLLARYRFHFRDMGLDPDDGEHVQARLIGIAHTMIQQFADVQPDNTFVTAVLGRMAVDLSLGYLAPEHSFHALLGLGSEVGYSGTFSNPDLRWLRFGIALGFDGISSILNGTDDYIAFIPKAGLEFEVYGAAAVQFRVGLRAGFQFSSVDGFLGDACDHGEEARLPCSRMVTEVTLAASLLGLLRIQLAAVYEPGLASGQDARFLLRPTVGFQVNSPF
ncbi:MAG: putative acylesterase/phospholipase RssA [Myxococcota bacterium]|jgi:predicted acylesterase/phospholipase RssA